MKWNATYAYIGLGVLGIAGGLIYWNFWACTDACPIDSSPYMNMLRGGLVGLVIASFIPFKKKKTETPEDSNKVEDE